MLAPALHFAAREGASCRRRCQAVEGTRTGTGRRSIPGCGAHPARRAAWRRRQVVRARPGPDRHVAARPRCAGAVAQPGRRGRAAGGPVRGQRRSGLHGRGDTGRRVPILRAAAALFRRHTDMRTSLAVAEADGRELPADLLVMATGVRPNTALARAAGLAVGRGVLVDDPMMTSDPHVFARPGLKAVDMFEAVMDGWIRAIWIMATSPAHRLPRADRVHAALRACPFVGCPTAGPRTPPSWPMWCCLPRPGARRTAPSIRCAGAGALAVAGRRPAGGWTVVRRRRVLYARRPGTAGAHAVSGRPGRGDAPFLLNTGRVRDQWHTMTHRSLPRADGEHAGAGVVCRVPVGRSATARIKAFCFFLEKRRPRLFLKLSFSARLYSATPGVTLPRPPAFVVPTQATRLPPGCGRAALPNTEAGQRLRPMMTMSGPVPGPWRHRGSR